MKAVRANGLRRSRSVGAAKTHLQQVLTATAVNLGRIADWIADHRPAQTRKSAFIRRMTQPAWTHPFASSIEAGTTSIPVLSALRDAETRKAELAVANEPAPRLMPNLAELYRAKVAALQDALGGEDAAAAREQIRALIDEVRLVPSPTDPKAPPAIEVRGELAAMLALGSEQDASVVEQLGKQMKLVAGAGFEPAAFRL